LGLLEATLEKLQSKNYLGQAGKPRGVFTQRLSQSRARYN